MRDDHTRLGALPVSRRQAILAGTGAVGLGVLGLPLIGEQAFAAGKLVALVHTQAAGDDGPIDDMIAHLKALSKEKDFPIRAIYAADPSTYQSILTTLAKAGAGIIVTTFNEMADPLKAVAPAYPDTKFIQLYADPFNPTIPNILTVEYQAHYGMYLAGLFGANRRDQGVELRRLRVDPLEAVLDVGGDVLFRRVVVRAGFEGVVAGDLADHPVERRREEQRLAIVGGLVDDPVDGGTEAHVEHPVGLVEDEDADLVERDGVARDQVLEPARRRDQDVGLFGAGDLRAEADAAVDRGKVHLAGAGEAFELIDDLRGELAGRGEDQGLRAPAAGLDDVDQRHAEGERLARSGR